MKILDKYILKTFLITFTSVFVILFFIFILQTVWLFIAELAGKDLDFILILKFLGYSMPNVVPLVLPLSVLLASIMTFGDLSENYEFAAMKSSGVSLQRAMKSLIVFIVILSIAAFTFANNVIPYASFKFISFRQNIAQVKPALAVAEGQFSEVGPFNIKVEKKSGPKGNELTGVTIHKKKPNGSGVTNVIKAERGQLLSSEDSNMLQLILYNGFQYEDIVPNKYEERRKIPFAKTAFKKYTMNLDLSQLSKGDSEETIAAGTNTMLNIRELHYTLDSLNLNYKNEIVSFAENIHSRSGIESGPLREQFRTENQDSLPKETVKTIIPDDILADLTTAEQSRFLELAFNSVTSTNFSIQGSREDFHSKRKNINNHYIAIHEKFVMGYACILLFFIGAPLGAIIRKGGLGLPIVFAVLIFITFHFTNTFGKKIAQEDGLTPFLGVWMSSIILTPFALLLTYRATNDIGLINMDAVFTPIQNLFKKIFNKNKDKKDVH
ncbi:LptF/LptG family permease [Flavobacterium tegetincola]|uniref:LptF/LptG family permease n=1 Tax=Flavobacterium tegetincola TaxID=150172 RepID=UPI0003F9CCC5|nr:LptF/LptG family permease [Flavobacterium tegetincola]